MSKAEAGEQLAETPDPYGAYPRLSPEQIEALEAHGTRRETTAGEVIFRAGDKSYDFVVVLQGLVAIVEPDHGAERLIAVHGAGRFLGELNLLTGETVVRVRGRARAGRGPRRAGRAAARARRRGSRVRRSDPARVHHPPLDPDRPPYRAADRRLPPLARHAAAARVRRAQPAAAQLDRPRGVSGRRDAAARAGRRRRRDAGGDLVRRKGAAQSDERRARPSWSDCRSRRARGQPATCSIVGVGPGRARRRRVRRRRRGSTRSSSTLSRRAGRRGRRRGSRTTSASPPASREPSSPSVRRIQAEKFGARHRGLRAGARRSLRRDGHYVIAPRRRR